jgi:uncharacterized protein (DUF2062 family)
MSRSLWQRRVIDPLLAQLTQGTSPEKITQSLVIGSLGAFFPILGAATPVCVAAAWIFRLNQPLVQAVNWLTAPLYLPLVFAFLRLGDWILGRSGTAFDAGRLAELLRHDPAGFAHQFAAIAGHAVVGWAAAAPLWWLVGSVLIGTPVRLVAGRLAAGRSVNYAG